MSSNQTKSKKLPRYNKHEQRIRGLSCEPLGLIRFDVHKTVNIKSGRYHKGAYLLSLIGIFTCIDMIAQEIYFNGPFQNEKTKGEKTKESFADWIVENRKSGKIFMSYLKDKLKFSDENAKTLWVFRSKMVHSFAWPKETQAGHWKKPDGTITFEVKTPGFHQNDIIQWLDNQIGRLFEERKGLNRKGGRWLTIHEYFSIKNEPGELSDIRTLYRYVKNYPFRLMGSTHRGIWADK